MHNSSYPATDTPLIDPAPSQVAPPSPLRRAFFGADGLRAGWSLLLFFALLFVIGYGTNRIVHTLHPGQLSAQKEMPPALSLSFEAVQFGLVALATFIMSRIERRPLRAYGIGATPLALPHFLAGLAWGALMLSLLVGTLVATHLLVFTGLQLSAAAILRFGAEWAVAFLFVGLFEEYALRGYLQFTLARGLAGAFHSATSSPHAKAIGFWISAAIFSFIFGFGHKSNIGESPVGLLSAGSSASSSASPSGEPARSGGPSASTPPGTGPNPSFTASPTPATWSPSISSARTRRAKPSSRAVSPALRAASSSSPSSSSPPPPSSSPSAKPAGPSPARRHPASTSLSEALPIPRTIFPSEHDLLRPSLQPCQTAPHPARLLAAALPSLHGATTPPHPLT